MRGDGKGKGVILDIRKSIRREEETWVREEEGRERKHVRELPNVSVGR